MRLRGETVLITGGSRGLGRALALDAARRAARVVVVARGRADLDSVVAEIRAGDGEGWAIAADVGEADAVSRIAAQAAALAGPPSVVVHDASTLGAVPLPPLADMDPDDLARALEVNVLGPHRLSRALLGPMLLRGRGLMIGLSSDAAVNAYPTWGGYGASKAALDHLFRVWAAELEGTGVVAFTVDPGDMDTEMHAAAVPDADPAELVQPADVAWRLLDAVERGVPNGARLVAAELGAAA